MTSDPTEPTTEATEVSATAEATAETAAATEATETAEAAEVQGRGRAYALSPWRVALAAASIAAGVALVIYQEHVRVAEAALAAPLLGTVMARVEHVPGSDLVFYPDYASDGLRALKVTLSCSASLIAGPMLVLGGAMALVRKFSPLRAVIAMTVAAGCMFGFNLVRISLIAVLTRSFGRDGYEISHRVVGSGLVLVAATVGFVLAYRIVAAYASIAPSPRHD